MLSEKMEKALNDQIREEMYSAYLYLAMAAWFESKNLKGFANWMTVQFSEEQKHARKFYGYIYDRNGVVKLQTLKEPPSSWDSPLAAFQDAYKHEQYITARINNLVEMAIDEKDRATQVFLDWFVNEQVEEEASTYEVAETLKMVGDKPQGLYIVNRELGQRKAD